MALRDYLATQNLIAAVALYGAVLSTFNFIRDRRKETLKVEVSARREFMGSENIDVYVVNILNQSFFKIEILYAGFAVYPDPAQKTSSISISPSSEFKERPKLPVEVELKRLFQYPIETELINYTLLKIGLVGHLKLQPYAVINDKKFFGESIYFNAISKQDSL
jgi:hypothetical protein